jgi:hypothetical protein
MFSSLSSRAVRGWWLALAVAFSLAVPAAFAGDPLWDTGPPRQVLYDAAGGGNHALTYLGFSSGDIGAGSDQRWSAQAFSLPEGNWRIDQIDADWFVVAGFEFTTINWTVWSRTGTARPEDGDQVITGSIAASSVPDLDDPEIPEADIWLHQIPVDFDLAGGDYYLTLYASDTPNNHTANLAWLTNADNGLNLVDENDLAYMWRSALFPAPGFAKYQLSELILKQQDGLDPKDVYNTSFTIYGTPEPGTLGLLALGGLAALRRRS